MGENRDDSWRPVYKNELSIFKKETLEKVEEFRAARTNWITSYSNQIMNKSTKEGLYKSNEYKGRCAFLRRIRFKTTFLRVHHKTLRPLKFYTFKRKLSDSEIERAITQSLENLLNREKSKTKNYPNKDAKYNRILASKDNFQKEKGRKKRKWKKKRHESDNYLEQKLVPSKKAIEKLKASKFENGLIESCRCEDGKELTVVIKGVCLCDKTSLSKFNLDKVRNEYTRLENENKRSEEPKLLRVVDSLELAKAKMSQNYLEEKNGEKSEKIIPPKSPSEKTVKFKEDLEETGQEFVKKDDGGPLYKSTNTAEKRGRTPPVESKNQEERAEMNGKDHKVNDKISMPEPHAEKNLTLERPKDTAKSEEEIKADSFNESTITLYKNKPQEESGLGLTREQYQKMKKNSEKKGER